ncbi:MAG: GTPase Era [Rickettsiales bacterium]|jgi:GTP-binding protein Era|nr:GTPase Era [Rickettsiales bacterium]
MASDQKENELLDIGDTDQRCLGVVLAGLPNAGKSSLFNIMVGEKLSIVTPKEQTTRDIIMGAMVDKTRQLVFIDSPGIFIPRKSRSLERKIVKNAWKGLLAADIACIVIDSTAAISENLRTTVRDITRKQEKIIFTLNKVDLVKKGKLLTMAAELSTLWPKFLEIFMISTVTGENVNKLKEYLLAIAPKRPWLFAEDEITNVSEKFIASEMTREKLFLSLRRDLPYSVDVVTDSWENFDNGSIRIRQTIRVLKDSQKSIVLGKAGSTLKNINIAARKDMESFFGTKIHLFIFVRSMDTWLDEKF